MGELQKELAKVEIKRPPRRIYHRPAKAPKLVRVVKLRSSWGLPAEVTCKLCYKRISQEEAVLVGGGGTQGHREFYMCLKHK